MVRKKINRVLIANRGEIANRILNTLNKIGVESIALYHEDDINCNYIDKATYSIKLEGVNLSANFLNANLITGLAIDYKCDAIHPGYGFLSENYEFAKLCEVSGLVFIGPSADIIKKMGNKIISKEIASACDIPMLKSLKGDINYIINEIDKLKLPVIIKAAAGGGGRGMRIIYEKKELELSLDNASKEALNNFGDGTVYVEEYLVNPKHIEVQILGDNYGNVIHLFERDCSIQRRYQKIVEESPSCIDRNLSDEICSAAVKLSKSINYNNAGTVEFLVDGNNYYFLEMNTRIQVEHPVTEEITGIDIVEEQLKISSGEKLSYTQDDIKIRGHAIEVRLYAEDPVNDFIPSPGEVTFSKFPELNNVRYETAFNEGKINISPLFDPQISKVISWGKDRSVSLSLLLKALDNLVIRGIKTNKYFLKRILSDKDFANSNYNTHTAIPLLNRYNNNVNNINKEVVGLYLYLYFKQSKSSLVWYNVGNKLNRKEFRAKYNSKLYSLEMIAKNKLMLNNEVYEFEIEFIDDKSIEFKLNNESFKTYIFYRDKNNFDVISKEGEYLFEIPSYNYNKDYEEEVSIKKDGLIYNDLPGKISKVLIKEGMRVTKDQHLVSLESMKIENKITSPLDGIIKNIFIKEGDVIKSNQLIIEVKEDEK